ncbi:lipopolysaccharide biosynthesis protein [Lentimonas sp. CC11]|uniref:lipopolysaccharide biosynthesis protein n=1 Tax=Lentimonas sp. CC11 TaxID=2676096 RepID=UPI001328C512|nr:hypothetical protein [Lentimonas sp. CC11]CAA6693599.1 Unannotated [Lentimonas sp. CC10]CAA6696858.1 Unannotated [Lentimonas sp. CC19]CAA7071178.1 Unannotated [Lentimonas sp. CC11]
MGSSVAWLSILLSLLGQVLLVPVFLTYWSAATYGTWLALQATVGLLSMFSLSYQTYLQGEFLKVGREEPGRARQLLWTALPVAWGISALELLGVLSLYFCIDIATVLGVQGVAEVNTNVLFIILLAFALKNFFLMPFAGIAVKLLVVYGHYSRMALWGVLRLVLTLGTPVIALFFGGDFLQVGLVWVSAHMFSAVLSYIDVLMIMRREQLLAFERPEWRRAFRMLGLSQAITVRDFLNTMRNNGVRIVMSSFLGGVAVATFSTNRTVANVLRQGVGTITNPLLPELMHAVNRREQAKIESLFAIVWLLLLIFLVPGFLLMQNLMAPVFSLWTQGKVAFDSSLFAWFSGTILLFTVGQPAFAIISGNNLLRVQLVTSLVVGGFALLFIFILVPLNGIVGAAIGLFAAEMVSLMCLTWACRSWMLKHGMGWPIRSQGVVLCGVVFGFGGLVGCSEFGGAISWGICCSVSLCSFYFAYLYYRTLPHPAQAYMKTALLRLPFLRKALSAYLR